LLGVTLWWPMNWVFDRKKELRRTIAGWNDYLELLLTQALDETRQVSITLKNGKVYVGFVVQTFDPAYDRKYLVVLPTMSGYREATTHRLEFITDYTRVYQQLIAEDETRLILSASLFDWDAYRRFNPPQTPAGQQ
jgi:hypothetical protein